MSWTSKTVRNFKIYGVKSQAGKPVSKKVNKQGTRSLQQAKNLKKEVAIQKTETLRQIATMEKICGKDGKYSGGSRIKERKLQGQHRSLKVLKP